MKTKTPRFKLPDERAWAFSLDVGLAIWIMSGIAWLLNKAQLALVCQVLGWVCVANAWFWRREAIAARARADADPRVKIRTC